MSLTESEDWDIEVSYNGEKYDCSLVQSITGTYQVAVGYGEDSYESLGFLFQGKELIATFDGNQRCFGVTEESVVIRGDHNGESIEAFHYEDGVIAQYSPSVGARHVALDPNRRYIGINESGHPAKLERRPETYVHDLIEDSRVAAHVHGSGTNFDSIGFVTHRDQPWLVIRHSNGADHALSFKGVTTHLTPDWDVYEPDPIYVLPTKSDPVHLVVEEKSQSRDVHRIPGLTYDALCGEIVNPADARLIIRNDGKLENLPYDLCDRCYELF